MSILGSIALVGVLLLICLSLGAVDGWAEESAPSVTVHVDPPRRAGVDGELMLGVIRDVESENHPEKIGRRGERSAYQFMPAVWAFHTRQPFQVATLQPAVANLVAQRHFLQLRKELSILRLPWTPEFIASAWHNGSPHAAEHARDDDAQRAAALYWARIEARKQKATLQHTIPIAKGGQQ